MYNDLYDTLETLLTPEERAELSEKINQRLSEKIQNNELMIDSYELESLVDDVIQLSADLGDVSQFSPAYWEE